MTDVCNVARYLPEAARDLPDTVALRAPVGGRGQGAIAYESLTFAQLEERSRAAALFFQDKGIRQGMRTLLMVKPGLDLITCVFALFKLGAPPVVIDPGMGLRGFLRCVRHAEPEALVGIPLAHWVARLFPRPFISARVRVTVGRHFARQLSAWQQGVLAPVATREDDLAAVLFTSGSTGPAKGVLCMHRVFEAQVRLIREHYGIQPGEVDLPMLPVFALFNPALGMTTVVPRMNPSRPAKVNPADIVQAIHQNEVSNSFGSPVLWSRIVNYCERTGQSLPSLRRVLMAGAPVSPTIIRRLKALMPEGEVHTPYGATEALPVSSISGTEILEDTWALTVRGKGTCVGRALPGVSIRVVSTEPDEALCSPGQIGEIQVSGPNVTEAYDRLPEATARSKVHEQAPDGSTRCWHRMGDLGYFDSAGRLWFCGRKVERVLTPQGPLYTTCVEEVYNTHPDVFRTALIGLGKPGQEQPALVVEPMPGKWPRGRRAKACFQEALQDHVARMGLDDAVPLITRYFFCKRFPVDVRHNAKIHRLQLKHRFDR